MSNVKTLTVTFNLIPAPDDIGAVARLLHKAADDLRAIGRLPDVMALRDHDDRFVGAVGFAIRDEPVPLKRL
jgi:hypothetical protein